jgi:hypothetical protein
MKTVGHHKPSGGPRGDYTVECDICGVVWWRSKLRMRPVDGRLLCPDEGDEKGSAALSQGNAAASRRQEARFRPGSGGAFTDLDAASLTFTHYKNASDAGL